MKNSLSPEDRKYWVLVADESHATVYVRETRHAPMQELFSLENDIARMKATELISDRGGRAFDSYGEGRHTMASEKGGPQRESALRFAKTLAAKIKDGRHRGVCRDYALVAAPRFLGDLRQALETAGAGVPYAEFAKDLVGHDVSQIEHLLDQR